MTALTGVDPLLMPLATGVDPLPWFIAGILGLTLLEGVGLLAYDRLTRRGLPSRVYLLNWASGVCLLAGMLSVVLGGGSVQVLPWLLGAGVFHAWDLKRAWRRSRRRCVAE